MKKIFIWFLTACLACSVVVTDTTANFADAEDTLSWTNVSLTQEDLQGVAWNGRSFLVVGPENKTYQSNDGVNWTAQKAATHYHKAFNVAWGAGKFIAAGQGNAFGPGDHAFGNVYASEDGTTWTSQIATELYSIYDLAYSGSQFVAVGQSNGIYTSSDGNRWNYPTLPYSGSKRNDFRAVI